MKGDAMKPIMKWLAHPPTDGAASIVLLRLMAGGVFFWEGILKFIYVNQGVGRFTKLGMPVPALTAGFVGVLEIVGGALLLGGFLTRFIAVPFLIEMLVAMLSTKISLYLGTSPLPPPPAPPQVGMWAVLHEVRSEYAQFLTVLFLAINGPGKWSFDALIGRAWKESVGELRRGGVPLVLSEALSERPLPEGEPSARLDTDRSDDPPFVSSAVRPPHDVDGGTDFDGPMVRPAGLPPSPDAHDVVRVIEPCGPFRRDG
jgi:uncharacterized membrane protein YphA (DoxX/SURF4 family)